MRVTGISWLGLAVDDLEPSVDFFQQTLGIDLIDVYGDDSAKLVAGDRQVIELFGPKSEGHGLARPPVIGFEVDDVKEARAELEARGVEMVGEVGAKHGYEWQFFKGPGGTVFALKKTPTTLR